MGKKKPVRQRGKIRLSEYFKNLSDGDRVAIVAEKGVRAAFPSRIQGLVGKVTGTRGNFKIVEIKDKDKMKTFIIHPVHLKKV
ncbi:50S ribosomal protein L21e [Candidatus Pacearchaeota archaeon]|nr:50S ribosomal protein L21e [Candidatus Pacearchaeota archaeon]|tara:strand:- start:16174 stop:16422 length:249 start_codon:yes stop_codon:yes gene_type:complete